MNHFSQQLNMSHISQCKPLVLDGALASRAEDQDTSTWR